MNRNALQSVCRRVRPTELDLATRSLSPYFLQFSTSTQLLADEANQNSGNGVPNSSNLRQNLQNSARGGRGGIQTNGAPRQQQQQPRIVDVKSLPQGGLRGRGGSSQLRGSGRTRGSPGSARGGARGRGGQGARRGGGRGGADRPRRNNQGEEEEEQSSRDNKGRFLNDDDVMEPSEQAFEHAMRFGVETPYNPELTRESLAADMPAVPSASGYHAARVHDGIQSLGTADRVGRPAGIPPSMYALDLEERGLRYFADVESKQRTEEHMQKVRRDAAAASGAEASSEPIIRDAEESIRKVIMDEAVAGKYEALEFTSDPVAISRNWHLRSETWGAKERRVFEEKLSSMLNKSKATPTKAKA